MGWNTYLDTNKSNWQVCKYKEPENFNFKLENRPVITGLWDNSLNLFLTLLVTANLQKISKGTETRIQNSTSFSRKKLGSGHSTKSFLIS